MKNFFAALSMLLLSLMLFAQAPESINYQAVVRNSNGNILDNASVGVQFRILEASSTGTSVYVEQHSTISNDFGLVNVQIGTGTVIFGVFSDIDWGADEYFLEVGVDEAGGSNYVVIGSSQLISVPYALHSKTAEFATSDLDTDPTNEFQIFKVIGDTVNLSNGNSFVINDIPGIDDQTLSLQNDTLFIEGGNGVDLSTYLDNTDAQVLSVSNDTLFLSNGGFAILPNGFSGDYNDLINTPADLGDFTNNAGYITDATDADADSTNELQLLSLSGDTVFLSDGGFILLPAGTVDTDDQTISISNDSLIIQDGNRVDLSAYLDNTDAQVLSINDDTVFLSNGGFVILPAGFSGDYNDLINTPADLGDFTNNAGYITDATDADADSTNELQLLSLSGDTVFLSDGGFILLPAGTVDTDDQTISISNDSLIIQDGNSIDLSAYLDNTDAQVLSINDDTVFLSNGGFVILPAQTVDTDDQILSISNDSLIIQDGNRVDLSAYLDNTDAQVLSINDDTVFLSNGGFVILPAQTVDTDDQILSISNDSLIIQDGNRVDLSAYLDNTDAQVLSINDDTVFLSNGGFVILPAGFSGDYNDLINTPADLGDFTNNAGYITDATDADADSTNELQLLSLSGDTVFLSDGGFILLPPGTVDTDDQTLSLSNDTLSIVDGNAVYLGDLSDDDADSTNELQTLSFANDSLFISDGNGLPSSLFADSLWLRNGSIVYNNSNRVGINTTTPDWGFAVSDGEVNAGFGVSNNGNGTHLIWKNYAGVKDLFFRFQNNGGTIDTTIMTIKGNGGYNIGIGTQTPQEKLHVIGSVQIEDGTQQNGYVLTSDANGASSWQDPNTLIDTLSLIIDADGDTKVQVEESPDEDVIRFDIAGSEYFRMEAGRIEVSNTGNSVNIGVNAGLNDDFTNNRNVAIGLNAGRSTTTGENNVAIGRDAFRQNTTGSLNIALGNYALRNNTTANTNVGLGHYAMFATTTGESNVGIGSAPLRYNETGGWNYAIGNNALFRNVSGNYNIAIGRSAGYNALGSNNIFIGDRAGNSETGSNRLYIDNSGADSANALIYGEFDNDLLTVNAELRINDGSQQNGYVFASDATGLGSWQDPATLIDDSDSTNELQTLSFANDSLFISDGNGLPADFFRDTLSLILDDDGDTYVNVEQSPDEDLIRFGLAGTEHFRMNGPRLQVLGSGLSVFVGDGAGQNDDLSNNANVSIGYNAGQNNVDGSENVSIGYRAMQFNVSATNNVAMGSDAMRNTTGGNANVGIGSNALLANTTGSSNAAFGKDALQLNTTGSNNTAIGRNSMLNSGTGSGNTAVGATSLFTNASGSNNTAVGNNALQDNISGSGNVALGSNAGHLELGSNKLYIENSTADSTGALIWGDFANDIVTLNGNVGIGTNTPSTALHVLPTSANGPTVTIETGSNTYPSSLAILPSTHATSERATVEIGEWGLLQDITGNGTEDFAIYNNAINDHALSIATNNNIGIGTTSPESKLDIRINSDSLNIPLILRNEDNTQSGGAAVGIGFMNQFNSGNMIPPKGVIAFERTESWGRGDFHFLMNNEGNSDGANLEDAEVTITRGGDVGIGTTSPGRNLHLMDDQYTSGIVNSSSFGTALILTDNQSRIYWEDPTQASGERVMDMRYINGRLNIGSLNDAATSYNYASTLVIDNNNRVGINELNPDTTFHVTGSVKIEDGTQASGYVFTSDANGVGHWTDPDSLSDGDWIVDDSVMYNNNAGNLGIGTNNPQWDVTVRHNNNVFYSPDSINQYNYAMVLEKTPGTNNEGIGLGFGSSNSGSHSGAGIVFKKTGNNSVGDLMLAVKANGSSFTYHKPALTVKGITGNIGIGTTSPDATLDLVGSLQYTDGNQAAGYILTSDANGNASWQANSGVSATTWTTWAPSVEDGAGNSLTNTITSSRYKTVDSDMTFFELQASVTTGVSGTNYIDFSLPNTPSFSGSCTVFVTGPSGLETTVAGVIDGGEIRVAYAGSGFSTSSVYNIRVSGFYEY